MFERITLASITWRELRDTIMAIEAEQNSALAGQQCYARLFAGIRAQIETHADTGITNI